MVKAKKLRKPRKIVLKQTAVLEIINKTIFIGIHCPPTMVLYAKEARKMAEWLNRAADWAAEQEKEANQW